MDTNDEFLIENIKPGMSGDNKRAAWAAVNKAMKPEPPAPPPPPPETKEAKITRLKAELAALEPEGK